MLVFLVTMLLVNAAPASSEDASDVLYQALFGAPEAVDAGALLEAPGRYVGHAVRVRGRLERSASGALDLVAGPRRASLHLQPEAAATVASYGSSWQRGAVEVTGFFYRESGRVQEGRYALRAWSVRASDRGRSSSEPGSASALEISLEQLVYGAGRYDGQLVVVGGTYRGANLHNDLPEGTRAGSHDWVIKDGYFAVWVTGREARGDGWDLTRLPRDDTDTPLEVVGIPRFRGGVVRLEAREVRVSAVSRPPATSRGLGLTDTATDAGAAPKVTFAYPVAGDTLDALGHMIVQFSHSMDPTRFEAGVRVRYERDGRVTSAPQVRLDYRDRYRALVITPLTPPPGGTVVVVELLGVVVDVDGHGLAPRDPPGSSDEPRGADDRVDQVRFRSAP